MNMVSQGPGAGFWTKLSETTFVSVSSLQKQHDWLPHTPAALISSPQFELFPQTMNLSSNAFTGSVATRDEEKSTRSSISKGL